MEIKTFLILYNYKNLPIEIIREINSYTYEELNNNNIKEAVRLWIENKELCIFKYGHISYWNVRKVTDMSYLFSVQFHFNEDISRWNVSNVKNFSAIFYQAYKFNQDLSNWNVSNATNMSRMFHLAILFNCNISKWNVSNVTNMSEMFREANSFNQDLSEWNVSRVTNMYQMFLGAFSFNSNLSNWDVANVIDMGGMFWRATLFNSDLSKWNVGHVRNMTGMFYELENFNSDLSNWNVSNVIYMSEMFNGALSFNCNLSQWNVNKVQDMEYMFTNAINFTSDLSNWNTGEVKNMSRLFYNARKFSSDLSNWNTSNVLNMSGLFENTSFTSDLSRWNVSLTTDMSYMFANTSKFNSNIINWDIRNLKESRYMFYGAKNFQYDTFCKKLFLFHFQNSYPFLSDLSPTSLTPSKKLSSALLQQSIYDTVKFQMKHHFIPECKICLVGSGGVGKSSFLRRYISGEFEKKYYVTIGPQTYVIPFFTNYGEIRVQFVDISTSERLPNPLRDIHYYTTFGAIIFFDLTSRITYKDTPRWYREISRISEGISIIICGNKLDLKDQRKVKPEQITYPQKKNIPYFETSVKKSIQIEQPILLLLRQFTGFNDLKFVNESSSSLICPVFDESLDNHPIWERNLFETFEASNIPLDNDDDDDENNDDINSEMKINTINSLL